MGERQGHRGHPGHRRRVEPTDERHGAAGGRGKVLLETANWSQGEPYNRQTPTIKGKHTVTGCVATAMGIIMKYHEYPIRAVNPPEYNYYSIDGYYSGHKLSYGDYDWGICFLLIKAVVIMMRRLML